jgi:type I restriction enzyme, S subunit
MTVSRPNSLMTTMSAVHPIEAFTVPSDSVVRSGYRLEGSFYGSDGYRAARAMFHSGFKLETLGSFAAVRWPGIFARRYVQDPAVGIPFLTTSDVAEAKPSRRRYISAALTVGLGGVTVSAGDILVTRSGTVGRVILCTQNHAGVAVSEDALRVLPISDPIRGLLYCYLQSAAGQFLVVRSKSGSVVEHLYEDDLRDQIIPVLPLSLRSALTKLVDDVSRLRVEANRLLDEAESEVQIQCRLPNWIDLDVSREPGSLSGARVFLVSSGEVFGRENQFGAVRLDVTYYHPLAARLREVILGTGGKNLSNVLRAVRNSALRKRLYVDDLSDGVAMIGGKQLMQVRTSDVNYLSRALTRNLDEETVRAGWTLVSCGGTLGRTLFVHRNFEGWAVSQHVMRLLPDESQVWPGYLYAFIASPYGQIQLAQRSYGSVIPELRDFQFNSIAIAVPPDRGRAIHEIVVRAFDCRADALAMENEAIRLFETAIEHGKDATEEQWGREY